jgi:large subunit ribosomal protein L11
MAKKVMAQIKLQISAGKANPSPPIGPALGQHGVNIMEFCKQYNAQTAEQAGNIIPVVITVYEDRSFSFITKTPPVSELIKKAAGVPKGSAAPNKNKVGSISMQKVEEIAKMKRSEERRVGKECRVEMIKGSARSMGVTIQE